MSSKPSAPLDPRNTQANLANQEEMIRQDVGVAFISYIKKDPSPVPADADMADLIFGMSVTRDPRELMH